jgi:hypothetical protein
MLAIPTKTCTIQRMKQKMLTRSEMNTFVEGLIIKHFGSLEAFVDAFPEHFEKVDQSGQPLQERLPIPPEPV